VIVALVFVGGAIGAPSRYLLDRFVQSRHGWRFPLGTMAVNVIGCFVLGVLAGSGWSIRQHALIGTGFCGGLTTFSTFSVEAVELLQGRRGLAAAVYVLLSCAVGVGAAALGYALG
jgi:fluoride exporter